MKTISRLVLCFPVLVFLWGCTSNSLSLQPTPIDLQLDQPTTEVIPTLQSEITLEPMETGFPTNDSAQASASINELLLTNGGCDLPCFWGIIPGKTEWQEIGFLKNLAIQYDSDPAKENQEYFEKTFYFLVNMSIDVVVYKDLVRSLEVSDFESTNYELANFLTQYGQPDEIWVFTNSKGFGTDNHIGFLILFYYHEKQMTVSYSGNGEIGESWIVGCTTLSPHLRIWAWDDSLGFPESALNELDTIRTSWKPLNEATQGQFDVSKYYETFKESQNEPCIKTPKSIWSEP